MLCPYCQNKLTHKEQMQQDLIDEEAGITQGHFVVIEENYEYSECLKDGCAVYRDGKCHYNG